MSGNLSIDAAAVTSAVDRWLREVVIGLNLCPFAKHPYDAQAVAIEVVYPEDEEALRELLIEQMQQLDDTEACARETTLVVIPALLGDFFDYHLFMRMTGQLLKRSGYSGVYQFASFHPDYVFAGAADDAVENFTNRAPYPIIHIIREASLARALEFYPDVEAVPERNQALMASLSPAQLQQFFHYLYR